MTTMNALPPALLSALRQVLRPLVRLMLAKGMTYGALTDMLKELFVDVAVREFDADGARQTDSRVSLMTGVHRKDVRRLRREQETASEPPVSLGAQVVAMWSGLPEFTDEMGRPRPLPRRASRGGAQSFEALAARINTDIRSRSILDELLRLGVVRLDEDDQVVLVTEAFVAPQALEEMLFYFGHNLHDHAAASVHNVLGEGVPWLERSVHYSALSSTAVEELRGVAKDSGMRAVQAVNRKAMALEQRDRGDSPQRITFGVYLYAEPVVAEPVAAATQNLPS